MTERRRTTKLAPDQRLRGPGLGSPGEAVAVSIASPVAIMIGETDKIREVILLDGQPPSDERRPGAVEVAAQLAARIGGKNLTSRPAGDPTLFKELVAGQVAIVATPSADSLAASDPPPGAVLVLVLDQPRPPADGDRSLFSIQTAQI